MQHKKITINVYEAFTNEEVQLILDELIRIADEKRRIMNELDKLSKSPVAFFNQKTVPDNVIKQSLPRKGKAFTIYTKRQ